MLGCECREGKRKRARKNVYRTSVVKNLMAFEDALGKLNADYFFREFTFSSNKFKPNPNEELELADNVVWLDDLMIVYQVKERNAPVDTTPEREK